MNARPSLIVCALALLAAGPVLAQYKVVGPDGRVTYTDRPNPTEPGKITPMARVGGGGGAAGDPSLPFELRQVASRYPVTLYTGNNCVPCESGRQFLLRRGVPFTEKRVQSDDDVAALERLVGGRNIPALTVGVQPLRGFNEGDWANYLDAAGYPKESRLPRNWQPAAAQPLVARESAASAPAPSRAAAPAEPPRPASPSAPPPAVETGASRPFRF